MEELDRKLIFHNLSNETYEIDESSITRKNWIDPNEILSQESVCGIDQRKKVIATTQLPYMAICKLYMKAANGLYYVGSGWLINKNTVITAGHCVHGGRGGDWKKSIIAIPGKSGLVEPYGRYNAVSIMTTKGWIEKSSTHLDMGAIKIDREVSHNSFITPSFEDSSYGEICGYPADRDNGLFQYRMSDNLNKIDGRFYYQADTFGGQSGCPLLKDRSVAIGIHNYGGCPNKSSDLYEDFISGARNWN